MILRANIKFITLVMILSSAVILNAQCKTIPHGPPMGARSGAVGLSIGTKGYVGLGSSTTPDGLGTVFFKDFWEYNPNTDTWTQKADFPGTPRFGAVAFSIGSKGYVGIGQDNSVFTGTLELQGYNNDFYEYNPANNKWTQKADFGNGREIAPQGARTAAVGFSIGNKGYIGTGDAGSVQRSDFWEYNPATDTWTQKANFPGAGRHGACGFGIGTKGYITLGADEFSGIFNDLWQYDPANDTWVQKANFSGLGRAGAACFSIGSKAYIGTGGYSDFWEYNPVKDKWTQKDSFPGKVRGGAIGFSTGGNGYIGMGFSDRYENDLCQYNPVTNKWKQKSYLEGCVPLYEEKYRLKGKSVYADFQSVDSTGCIYTSVSFFGDFQISKDSIFVPFSGGITISIADVCQGLVGMFASGNAFDPSTLYISPDLSTGHFKATFLLFDAATFEIFPCTVYIKFTATRPVQVNVNNTITHSGTGITVIDDFTGDTRTASAIGTIFSPGSSITPLTGNQIPLPAYDAGFMKSKETSRTIIRDYCSLPHAHSSNKTGDNQVAAINNVTIGDGVIKLFPNPAGNMLHVTGNAITHYRIFNTMGALMIESNTSGNIFDIDLSGYDSGFYLLHLQTKNGTVVRKFVKE